MYYEANIDRVPDFGSGLVRAGGLALSLSRPSRHQLSHPPDPPGTLEVIRGSGKKVGNWREISMDNGDIAINYHKLSVIKFSTEKVGNAVRSPVFDSGLVRGGGLASGPGHPGWHQTIRPLSPG